MNNLDFKYSLAQLTVLNTSPKEITLMAARCGYDYVSLRQIYMGLDNESRFDLKEDKRLMKETKEVLEKTGVEVLDIELARIFDGVNIKDYEGAMEIAAELNCKNILSSIWTDDKNYYMEKFNELCEMGKQYGVDINLEYVPIAGVRNLDEAMYVIENTEFDNARLMIDTHHVHRAKDDPKKLRKVPYKYFNFLHLCDASGDIPDDKDELTRIMREERLYLGEGGIDIKEILNNVPIIPYSIELPNAKDVAEYGYEEHARQCLMAAKAYCKKYVTGR